VQDMKLVIAGGVEAESSYGEELKSKAKGLDVVFAGFVQGEKLEQLYRNARLYVLSSVNEGFPLVLLEAMSYGLDVLVSDIPATHLVELDKSDYFEKANINDLAQKLREKLSKPLLRRIYNLDDFDWEKIADKVNEIYKSTLLNK
jgi:glycosyltransferase involved in cell wall biosynthesis